MATEKQAVYFWNLGVGPRVVKGVLPKEEPSDRISELQAYAAEAGLRRSPALDTSALQRVRAQDDALVLPPRNSAAVPDPGRSARPPAGNGSPGKATKSVASGTGEADESWWKLELSATWSGEDSDLATVTVSGSEHHRSALDPAEGEALAQLVRGFRGRSSVQAPCSGDSVARRGPHRESRLGRRLYGATTSWIPTGRLRSGFKIGGWGAVHRSPGPGGIASPALLAPGPASRRRHSGLSRQQQVNRERRPDDHEHAGEEEFHPPPRHVGARRELVLDRTEPAPRHPDESRTGDHQRNADDLADGGIGAGRARRDRAQEQSKSGDHEPEANDRERGADPREKGTFVREVIGRGASHWCVEASRFIPMPSREALHQDQRGTLDSGHCLSDRSQPGPCHQRLAGRASPIALRTWRPPSVLPES
jgi:hypothetical protein